MIPRPGNGYEQGESDALQADVMRFVAIVALCLAAIFSLLNGVRTSPASDSRGKMSEDPVLPSKVPPVTEPAPSPVSKNDPEPEPKPPPENPGESYLTLEFASVAAMEQQLASGAASLYVLAEDGAWRWQAATGYFDQRELPARMYQLDLATVPERYRRVFAVQEPDVVRSVRWGVVLATGQENAIKQWSLRENQGVLLIQGDGSVRHQHTAQGAR